MTTAIVYILAAIAEIAGCFSFWAWLRLDKSPVWIAPGMVSLAAFAWLLTRVDSDAAGRALCRLRRRLYLRVAGLALGRRRHAPGPLGRYRCSGLSGWGRHHIVCAT